MLQQGGAMVKWEVRPALKIYFKAWQQLVKCPTTIALECALTLQGI